MNGLTGKKGRLMGRIVVLAVAGMILLALSLCAIALIQLSNGYHKMGEEMLKAVVLEIDGEQGVTYAVMLDERGLNVNEEISGLKFIRPTDEVEQLLSKVKESEG